MPKEGSNAFYRAFADRWYLDKANKDNYLYRSSASKIGLSGGLVVPALETLDGVDLSVHAVDYGLHHKVVRKTADEIVNNSTTLQNDDELLLAIAASEVWALDFFLYWIQGNSATADPKFALVVPSGASLVFACENLSSILVTTSGSSFTVDLAANVVIALHLMAIVVNSTTAGDIQLQWAQQVAVAVDDTLKAGSYMVCHRVA